MKRSQSENDLINLENPNLNKNHSQLEGKNSRNNSFTSDSSTDSDSDSISITPNNTPQKKHSSERYTLEEYNKVEHKFFEAIKKFVNNASDQKELTTYFQLMHSELLATHIPKDEIKELINKRLNDLEQKLTSLTDENHHLSVNNDSLKQTIIESRKNFETLRESYEQEKSGLKTKLEDTENASKSKIDDLERTNNETLKRQKKDFDAEKEELNEKHKEELDRKAEELKQEYRNKAKKLEEKLQKANKDLTLIQSNYDSILDNFPRLETEENLRKQIQENKLKTAESGRIVELEERNQKLLSELEEELKKNNLQKKEYDEKTKILQNKIQNLNQENASLLEEHKEEIESLNEKNDKDKRELSRKIKAEYHKELLSINKKLQDDLDEKTIEYDLLSVSYRSLEEVNKKSQNSLKTDEKESKINEELERIRQEKQELQNQLNDLNEAKTKIEQENLENQKKAQELEKTIEDGLEKLLTEELKELNELQEGLKEEIKKYPSYALKSEENITDNSQENEEENEEEKSEESDLDLPSLERIKSEFLEIENNFSLSNEELETLREERRILNSKIEKQKQEIANLKLQNSQSNSTNQEQLANLQNFLAQENQIITSELGKVQGQNQTLQAELDKVKEENKSLKYDWNFSLFRDFTAQNEKEKAEADKKLVEEKLKETQDELAKLTAFNQLSLKAQADRINQAKLNTLIIEKAKERENQKILDEKRVLEQEKQKILNEKGALEQKEQAALLEKQKILNEKKVLEKEIQKLKQQSGKNIYVDKIVKDKSTKSELIQKTSENQSLQKKLEDLGKELENYKKQLNDSSKEIVNLKKNSSQIIYVDKIVEKEVFKDNNEIEKVRLELSKTISEKNSLTKELKTLKEENKELQAYKPNYNKAATILFGNKNEREQKIEIDYYRNHRARIHGLNDLSKASDKKIIEEIIKDQERALVKSIKKLINKIRNDDELSTTEIATIKAFDESNGRNPILDCIKDNAPLFEIPAVKIKENKDLFEKPSTSMRGRQFSHLVSNNNIRTRH